MKALWWRKDGNNIILFLSFDACCALFYLLECGSCCAAFDVGRADVGPGQVLHVVARVVEGDQHEVEQLLHDVDHVLERDLDTVGEQLLGVVADLAQVRVLLEEVEQLAGVGQPIGQNVTVEVVGVHCFANEVHLFKIFDENFFFILISSKKDKSFFFQHISIGNLHFRSQLCKTL